MVFGRWRNFQNNGFLFNQDCLTNKDFWKILSTNKYYINFALIKLYENKEEFDKNNWAIDLEIIDCEFVTIKVKNSKFIPQIDKNINKIKVEESN